MNIDTSLVDRSGFSWLWLLFLYLAINQLIKMIQHLFFIFGCFCCQFFTTQLEDELSICPFKWISVSRFQISPKLAETVNQELSDEIHQDLFVCVALAFGKIKNDFRFSPASTAFLLFAVCNLVSFDKIIIALASLGGIKRAIRVRKYKYSKNLWKFFSVDEWSLFHMTFLNKISSVPVCH